MMKLPQINGLKIVDWGMKKIILIATKVK